MSGTATTPAKGHAPSAGARDAGSEPPRRGLGRRPDWLTLALAAVLLVALGLRLWGLKHGLPFVYNIDERLHFVRYAVGMFDDDANPNYFANPAAFTYLLWALFAIGLGGRDGVADAASSNPEALMVLARASAAVIGTLACLAVYRAGAVLLDRRTGLLAAVVMATSCLTVFYSHFALNDVPALAGVSLVLLASAHLARGGGLRWFALAGAAVGLAAGTKYTAGVAALSIAGAAAPMLGNRTLRRRALTGLALSALAALAVFLVTNPYSVLDYGTFREDLDYQSAQAGAVKVGLVEEHPLAYYAWTLTWAFGWIPLAAALAGAVIAIARHRVVAAVLLPAPVVLVVFLAMSDRYYARWLLPAYPYLCLLAAVAGARIASLVAGRGRAVGAVALAVVAVALAVQGLVSSVHTDRVLARADTRALARGWLVENVPAGSKIAVEPIVPRQWLLRQPTLYNPDDLTQPALRGPRWQFFRGYRRVLTAAGVPERSGAEAEPDAENFPYLLHPALIKAWQRTGVCTVIGGSLMAGRVARTPDRAPAAVAYYRELAQSSTLVHRESPYRAGHGPVPFDFDRSYTYFPLDYARPGPEVTVHRLRGGRCGS